MSFYLCEACLLCQTFVEVLILISCHLLTVQESSLVVQALRLNTMSKLTFADSSRFDALVRDVFSGVNFTDVQDQTLMHALEQVYKEGRLELIPAQVCVYNNCFSEYMYSTHTHF